jgi:hypothetical protein
VEYFSQVICLNDAVEHTVVGKDKVLVEEQAKLILNKLSSEYYVKHCCTYDSYEEYQQCCFWHLHDTTATVIL